MKARTPPTLIADTVRLVKIGRIERDMRGLNRFRLVLFTQDMVAIKPEAEKIFGSCVEVDDKIHLHVIEEKVASDFLGSVKTVP